MLDMNVVRDLVPWHVRIAILVSAYVCAHTYVCKINTPDMIKRNWSRALPTFCPINEEDNKSRARSICRRLGAKNPRIPCDLPCARSDQPALNERNLRPSPMRSILELGISNARVAEVSERIGV